MKKYLIIPLILIVVAVIIYNNYSNDIYNDESERNYTHKLKQTKKINLKNNLRNPTIIKNKIYALNYYDQEILILDFNGNIINKYGGEGESPKKNQGIRYFNLNKDESVSIIDIKKNTLSQISHTDSLLFFRKYNSLINCGGQLNEDTFVISHYNNEFLDFRKNKLDNIEEEILNLDHNLFPNTEFSNIAYEGSFYSMGENDLFYIPYYNSNMIHIKENEIEYFQTIYNPDPVKYTQSENMVFNESVPHYYDVAFDKNQILILSKYGFQKNSKAYMVVDFYKVNSKEYTNSILIEKDKDGNYPSYLAVEGKNYYLFYDEYMTLNMLEAL